MRVIVKAALIKTAKHLMGARSIYIDRDTFQIGSPKTILGVLASNRDMRQDFLDVMIKAFGAQELFSQLGALLSVQSVNVEGDFGTFTGSIDDFAVLGKYMKTRTWATSTTTLLKDLFLSGGGGTFIDIGANIGLTLIPLATLSNVICYAFEPEPKNFSYLKRNIAVNCSSANVSLSQLALFDQTSAVQFILSNENHGHHRIQLTNLGGSLGEHSWPSIEVQTARLDDIISNFRPPLAVKIDTQGAEPNIFAGGKKTLEAAHTICFEFWPYGMLRMGGDVRAQIAFLKSAFTKGSFAPRDVDLPINWQPINVLCETLETIFGSNARPGSYFDVVVSK